MPFDLSRPPVIVITMGDPAGVGPEVTARALRHAEIWEICRPLVIGDLNPERGRRVGGLAQL
jgi:4-hydroxy-L-threonine phosphate dehydrogenase PdxA